MLPAAADPSRCLAFRLAAAQAREDDRRHHHGRRRGRGHLLGGRRPYPRRVRAALAPLAARANAADSCEAAWSGIAATQAAEAAQQRGGYHRTARPRRPRVSGGWDGALWLANDAAGQPARMKKSAGASARPSRAGALCGCGLRVRVDLYCSRRALSNGIGVCGGPARS